MYTGLLTIVSTDSSNFQMRDVVITMRDGSIKNSTHTFGRISEIRSFALRPQASPSTNEQLNVIVRRISGEQSPAKSFIEENHVWIAVVFIVICAFVTGLLVWAVSSARVIFLGLDYFKPVFDNSEIFA
jgi:hypothetical protein